MLKRTFAICILSVGVFLFVASGYDDNARSPLQEKPCPEPLKSAFRYAIIYDNEVNDLALQSGKANFRAVDVLLDPRSFSETTLKQLFTLLSNRFDKTDRLFVHVHTNLEDLYTPEEAEQILSPAHCNSLARDKYPWAIYNRTSEYEGFDYSANGPGIAIRTIKLRGKVP